MNNIYDLKLHEVLIVEDGSLFSTAMRVPGGFIYRSYDKSHQLLSCTFVPFDNEFMPESK